MSLILNKKRGSTRPLWLIILLIFISIIMIYLNRNNVFRYNFYIKINYKSKYPYIAVIVDDRAIESVVNTVNNVIEHIPVDWKVQIITPYENWSFYNKSSLNQYINSDRILLTDLEQKSNGLASDKYINSILTSSSFWHKVYGDKVLLFQIDAVLCSNSSYNINDFLQYDFVGAPWVGGGCCNGGLSLRTRSKILQMLENKRFRFPVNQINEDGWFTDNLPYFNGRVAPISIAKKFSVESIYHPRPFGVHKPHTNTIGSYNMNRLCQECPEVSALVPSCKTNIKVSNSTY
ncbi:unnamed protein product [Rotaria sordida]|uniref:DUF5672 domain-containing protein n=1 Tax=Rotaria sordida TaxID=392033 RepID=A0A819IFK0_9BILA|nr:unnamed protein product [Rotaria sordida]CAF1012162.1 unnamed protein product [Rotaria sordida]CAF3803120.1 unnamed protein product [Rotaria sordida]CAF3914022.1 unnamed protein product [Rotaria sordida]